ncbi:MAG: DNA polymerase III subunit beta [Muribaculaceae bacterium]|nr:DNA polymerase III subunit beta [Muribaculaceae bacterium]
MFFKVSSKAFYDYASSVSKVINPKNALSILNNFLLTLSDGHLTITGSDVENAMSATITPLDYDGEGSFCLDARRLVDLLKELPNQPLTVEINNDTLEVNISYSDGHYSMVALPGDQYPQYANEGADETPVTFDFPALQLAKGIENTLFAVGEDDFRPQMMGILFDIQKDSLIFVATDTRKLVRYTNSLHRPEVMAKCIVPKKPAAILKSFLSKDPDSMVEISMNSKSASFRNEDYVFNCRFIKGNFPDYTRVIPKNNPYELRVDRTRFLNSVRRVGIFVDPGYGMEKFKITNDHIQIKSSDTNLLTAGNEQIDCEYSGPEIVVGFSAPYMIEICNTIQSEQMVVRLSDPSRPGVFCPSENEENTDLLILLMPMTVTDF